MTSAPGDADEGAYVLAVEERFRILRGTPLLLSPADLQRVLTWYQDRVPLFIVLQALEDVFRKAAERRPPRTPRSLAFVRPVVRERFVEWVERRAGARDGVPSAVDAADRELFEAAAAAVEASAAPDEARRAAASALRAGGSPPAIAAALTQACLAALPAAERQALEDAARADIAPLAAEMTPEIRARAEASALARRVRGQFRLPDLALLPGL